MLNWAWAPEKLSAVRAAYLTSTALGAQPQGEDRAGCQPVGSEVGLCPVVCSQPGKQGAQGYKGSCGGESGPL